MPRSGCRLRGLPRHLKRHHDEAPGQGGGRNRGASGIGRALAARCAEEGARAVILADLDDEGARVAARHAEQCGGGVAIAVHCDVRDPEDVVMAINDVEAAFGGVDLYCANAGVGVGAGLDTADDAWDEAFAVNVRAHIAAARRLIPGWVRRGHGYFVSTASAAGLLSLVGSAPYSVTKHAAVAFAEWLAITYGEHGVRVSCVCPMGVRTRLLEEGLIAPGEQGAGLRLTNAAAPVLTAEDVAAATINGIADERFLILPHPQVNEFVRARALDHEVWLAGMRQLHAAAADAAVADTPATRAPVVQGAGATTPHTTPSDTARDNATSP